MKHIPILVLECTPFSKPSQVTAEMFGHCLQQQCARLE